MADGRATLDGVIELLARPYPLSSALNSKIESGVWMGAIEQLENRLILAYAMRESSWSNPARVAGFSAKQEHGEELMTLKAIMQSRLLVEQYIVSFASMPYEGQDQFPFREIMSKLLRFKASICHDPALRVLFQKTADAFEDQETASLPKITALTNDPQKRRLWYKYYGFYKALLSRVDFEAPALESMKFDPAWLKDDEGIFVLLYAYAIRSEQTEKRLPSILKQSERLLVEHPTLKPIHVAMTAYGK